MPQILVKRAILKGHLFGTVQTRNMFTAQVALNEGDTDIDIWSGYIGPMMTAIRPYMGSVWTIEQMEIQVRESGIWYTTTEQPYDWNGTASGDQIANTVAAVFVGVVSLYHAHGRKFWSGLAETAVNGNTLTSPAVAAFASAAAMYVSTYTSSNGGYVQPGIIGKDNLFHAFVSGFVSSLLGTMRRRKPGLGI